MVLMNNLSFEMKSLIFLIKKNQSSDQIDDFHSKTWFFAQIKWYLWVNNSKLLIFNWNIRVFAWKIQFFIQRFGVFFSNKNIFSYLFMCRSVKICFRLRFDLANCHSSKKNKKNTQQQQHTDKANVDTATGWLTKIPTSDHFNTRINDVIIIYSDWIPNVLFDAWYQLTFLSFKNYVCLFHLCFYFSRTDRWDPNSVVRLGYYFIRAQHWQRLCTLLVLLKLFW